MEGEEEEHARERDHHELSQGERQPVREATRLGEPRAHLAGPQRQRQHQEASGHVPGVDRAEGPQHQRRDRGRAQVPTKTGSSGARGPRAEELEADARAEQRERERDEVGVQIAVGEAESGELVDRTLDQPRAAPVVEARPARPEARHDLPGAVEVPDHGHQQGREPAAEVRAPPVPGEQVEAEREGRRGREREHVGQGEVEAEPRTDAGQLEHGGDHELAEVVVIERAAGEPRVEGRHGAALEDGVEVRHLHRPLPAPGGVPQIGVGEPHEQEREEGEVEDQLAGEHDPPALAHERAELTRAAAQRPPAEPRDHGDADGGRPGGERHQPQARQQPQDVGEQQQPERLGQHVAAVREPAKHHERHRPGAEREELHRQPEDQRCPERAVREAVPAGVRDDRELLDRAAEKERGGESHEGLRRSGPCYGRNGGSGSSGRRLQPEQPGERDHHQRVRNSPR